MMMLLQVFVILGILVLVQADAPPAETCGQGSGPKSCQLRNAYGTFTDRKPCYMAEVRYPSSETELVAAVAYGASHNMKMKAVSRFVHSIPKWTCAGGDAGLVISTKNLISLSVDAVAQTATVDSGVQLRPFLDEIAKYDLAFPTSPYWSGVSMAGVIGTGAHGSTLVGKGGAVHEYVVGMRMVVPATEAEGWAKVKDLDKNQLSAAKVHLGLLGAISTITFQLQPSFKRRISFYNTTDDKLERDIIPFAVNTTYGDVNWHPSMKEVIWRKDDAVPVSTPGNGGYALPIFGPTPDVAWAALRRGDESVEVSRDAAYQCNQARTVEINNILSTGGGVTNDGLFFTGFPAVGLQKNVQSSGGCQLASDNAIGIGDASFHLRCPWDPRFKGFFFFETTVSLPVRLLGDYIKDIKALALARPYGFCGISLYGGFYFRFVKKSSAYLGEPEDTVVIDVQYYRSFNASAPRLNEDIYEEMEQIGLFKYKGRAHWGKNRDVAFKGTAAKYPDLPKFLAVKTELDPKGLFSGEWSDKVLGISATPVEVFYDGCALEGICICKEDSHCNPGANSFCRPGLVWSVARVCRYEGGARI